MLRVDGGVGERDHDGQVVGDDVVHLPGDTGPFLSDRQSCLLVMLLLQACGTFLHGREVGARGPCVRPQDGGGDDHRGHRDEGGHEGACRRPAQTGQQGPALHDGTGDKRAAPA